MSGSTQDHTASMTDPEKVAEAMRRSVRFMPAATGKLVMQMLTPQALAVMSATLAAWAVSQAFGVGEFVDVILVVVGALSVGWSVFTGAKELFLFGKLATQARTDHDLDRAAQHFARAVVILGVAVIEAVLLRGRARTVAERGRPTVKPRIEVGPPPAGGNKLRVSRVDQFPPDAPPTASGVTDAYGAIQILRTRPLSVQRDALLHELVHRFFAPRTGPWLKLRAEARVGAYERSEIVQYIEETLAEGYSIIKQRGVSEGIEALRFPIARGYVTLSRLKYEGQVIGTVLLTGEAFFVSVTVGPMPPGQ